MNGFQTDEKLGFGLGSSPMDLTSQSFNTSMIPDITPTSPVSLPSVDITKTAIDSHSGHGVTDLSMGEEGPDGFSWGGAFDKMGGLKGIGDLMKGLGSLGSVYGALKGLKLAKEQLAFSKESYQTNLNNQTKSYNTELEDRAASRAAGIGHTGAEASKYVDAYMKKNKL